MDGGGGMAGRPQEGAKQARMGCTFLVGRPTRNVIKLESMTELWSYEQVSLGDFVDECQP